MKRTVIDIVRKALEGMGAGDVAVEVETPRDESLGDLSTPVAMTLARTLRKPPREIAGEIVKRISGEEMFEKIDTAGPGFINFYFSPAFLHSGMRSLLREQSAFLRIDVGRGAKVQIEFVSANPTGPLHLGHGRGAAVGGALSNLLEAAGYAVTREYYINDAGRQVDLLGQSVFARYKMLLGLHYPFPEEGYQGEYIKDAALRILQEVGERYKDETYGKAREFFVEHSLAMMLSDIQTDLEDFGVSFDTWQSERELYSSGAVQHALDALGEKGLMYESGGALWFSSTAFGDEKDRVAVKSDGQHTYFASDIAYHLKKIESGFDEIIDIWGADHHGYVPRLGAVIEALGAERERLTVLLVQMVSLLRGGEPVQMSKRAGEFVTLREVMEEVGADTAKFIFLTRRHDSHLGFDLEDAKASSAENPVYYVQYANARINSIFAHAGEQASGAEDLTKADLARLTEPEETRLMKKLLMYPVVFEAAALAREPHRITFYLQELAGLFHPYYNRHRVVTDNDALTRARLSLCEAVRVVLGEGLGVLGISAPEKM